AFTLDRYEITNLQYGQFVRATGHKPPDVWSDLNYLKGKDYLPVVDVTWHDAVAYCFWAGKRLPSQDEWELACRGNVDRRLYPWGDMPDVCKANTQERKREELWAIGSYSFADSPQESGDSPFGVTDMVGNVAEWTSSLYEENERVIRGGSLFDAQDKEASCVMRTHAEPNAFIPEIGFRCAMSAP
ncbi:MAG: formylglycine-generating enzyme family protein, partial [Anaerolineae bacterium]|nr:formylglycine-generating enzyme family protein [Anaerolineae bacterium]